jgi:XrtJ-associated TM-motif-TM protein
MKIFMRITFFVTAVSIFPVLAQAQSGCSDSPECPTPVLAIAGAVGLWAANRLKK